MKKVIDFPAMVTLLREMFSLLEKQDQSIANRINLLRRSGCPVVDGPVGQGRTTSYSLTQCSQVAVAFAFMDAGVSTRAAAEIVVDQWEMCAASLAGSQHSGDGRGERRWLSVGCTELRGLKQSDRSRLKTPSMVVGRDAPARLLGGRRGGDGPVAVIAVDAYRLAFRIAGGFAEAADAPLDDVRAGLTKLA